MPVSPVSKTIEDNVLLVPLYSLTAKDAVSTEVGATLILTGQTTQGEKVDVDIIKRGAMYDFIESHTNKGEYIERIVYVTGSGTALRRGFILSERLYNIRRHGPRLL